MKIAKTIFYSHIFFFFGVHKEKEKKIFFFKWLKKKKFSHYVHETCESHHRTWSTITF